MRSDWHLADFLLGVVLRAVHFGAGNIGRGFIGAALQESGYFVTFADVNEKIIEALRSKGSYRIFELGEESETKKLENFAVLHSSSEQDRLIEEIARAQIVTASVGAGILPRLAPVIAAGIEQRRGADPLVIMACENAINATDLLEQEIRKLVSVPEDVRFANTAVDRVVPVQLAGSEPDVAVEQFSEWVIDTSKLAGVELNIAGATYVSNLGPFIERKLYTVNTGHLTLAYLGQLAGHPTIATALADHEVAEVAREVLSETSKVLVTRHALDPVAHGLYVEKTLVRLANDAIDDTVERVGREPLRKLSRNERLVGPAALLSEMGTRPTALLRVVEAALVFRAEDPQVQKLQEMLRSMPAEEMVLEVCGIRVQDSLGEDLVSVFAQRQDQLLRA